MPWINCSTDIASLAGTGLGSRSRATTADKTYEFRMQHQGGEVFMYCSTSTSPQYSWRLPSRLNRQLATEKFGAAL